MVRTVPTSTPRIGGRVRLLAVPVVALVVVAGVWVTGGLLTDDATLAMVLTGAWLALAGGAAVVVGLRWRDLALPVVSAYAIAAFGIGGYLLYTSEVDRVVNEQVVTAAQKVATGAFRGLAHETTGTATVLEQPDGSRLLTLTDFGTDPGPDLRVYVLPQRGSDVTNAVDVGRLKGNRGDQQYDLPQGTRAGAVVIWCRAFSVAFGSADLTSAT